MLKTQSKRRRTKQQIKEDKEKEIARESEIQAKFARLEQLEMQMAEN